MFLQSSITSPLQTPSSTSFYSQTPIKGFSFSYPTLLLKTTDFHTNAIISCCSSSSSSSSSISKVHNYGTVDYERQNTPRKWSALYRKISMMENPSVSGASTVLNRWEEEGKKLTKWELSRVIKELRKYRRFSLALGVYEWIHEQGDRFRVSTSDTAIQLDLISKVHGVLSAEEYFLKLPDTAKDNRTYGALLNAYVQAKMKEKAESLIVDMRDKGYAMHSLPFNVMMTLYMKLKEYEKVIEMITEMLEKNIKMDIYSYNIWVTTCGSMGSVEKMEEVLQRMKLDSSIYPNWTTYSTMATMYMNMGLTEKARDCLKKVESRITARDRIPYHYLLSLYGSLASKEEVYRIWKAYKSNFPSIWNLGYHAMIASLVRLDDIEGAKRIFDEWLSARSTYDPRVSNLIMGWYVKNGLLDEAEAFLENVFEVGGKVNSNTWEILAEGYIAKQQISEALTCMKEAVSAEGAVHWKPKPANISTLLALCDEESDLENKEVLFEVMKQIGCLDNGKITGETESGSNLSSDRSYVDDDDTESNLLLSQIPETL
ncbi:pentatricopeptide repeat-containing protein At1g02150-like [Papaver somniferum]|nr:pentatricopeptide repeat-containing protein At1g02150-like [Papaver somniferum]